MRCSETIVTLGALASLSLAFPAPSNLGQSPPEPVGADRDGEHPIVVIDTHKVTSGGKECNVWHLNIDGPNVTPECRQWVTDADDSTGNRQTVDIQTVKLTDENAVCEKWHVESHENLVKPVCGEIYEEPGFGTGGAKDDDLRDLWFNGPHGVQGSPVAGHAQQRDEAGMDSVRSRGVDGYPPLGVGPVIIHGAPGPAPRKDLGELATDSVVADENLETTSSEKHIDPTITEDHEISTVLDHPLQPLPSLGEIQRMVSHAKNEAPGLVHYIMLLEKSKILEQAEPEFNHNNLGMAAALKDPAGFLELAKKAREDQDSVGVWVTEQGIERLKELDQDLSEGHKLGGVFASNEKAEKAIKDAEAQALSGASGTFDHPIGMPVVGKREAIETNAPESTKHEITAPQNPVPPLEDVRSMIGNITAQVPGFAVVLSRFKDSEVLYKITRNPDQNYIRALRALGNLFADPAAFLESAQQSRASMPAKHVVIKNPAFTHLQHAFDNVTMTPNTEILGRVLSEAAYANDIMDGIEDSAAAELAREDSNDNNDNSKLERRFIPLLIAGVVGALGIAGIVVEEVS